MIQQTFNKKLGYYVCDGLEFHSKVEACLYGTQNNKPVKWIFNDGIFNAHDWTQEPGETLDQLYDQRARQLREKYDYIILSYSGGADSHNIYESFRRQGLLIDEMVVNTMTKASEKFIKVDGNRDAYNGPQSEHELNLVPRLEEIKIAMPHTKISIYDQSDTLFETLGTVKDESWILTTKEGVNPIGITRFNYLNLDNVKHQFDKIKSIGLITGIEKPRTIIRGNRFYMRFNDRSANITVINEHMKDYENCTVEYFYWAPECVRMLIKQGHIIRKYLEAFPDKQPLWLEHRVTPALTRTVHERILRSLLYTTWNDAWYQADKAVSDWYSEFDRWFIDNYQETQAWKNWHAGIDFIKNNLQPFLKYNHNGQPDGLIPVAKAYDLGPINLSQQTWLE